MAAIELNDQIELINSEHVRPCCLQAVIFNAFPKLFFLVRAKNRRIYVPYLLDIVVIIQWAPLIMPSDNVTIRFLCHP